MGNEQTKPPRNPLSPAENTAGTRAAMEFSDPTKCTKSKKPARIKNPREFLRKGRSASTANAVAQEEAAIYAMHGLSYHEKRRSEAGTRTSDAGRTRLSGGRLEGPSTSPNSRRSSENPYALVRGQPESLNITIQPTNTGTDSYPSKGSSPNFRPNPFDRRSSEQPQQINESHFYDCVSPDQPLPVTFSPPKINRSFDKASEPIAINRPNNIDLGSVTVKLSVSAVGGRTPSFSAQPEILQNTLGQKMDLLQVPTQPQSHSLVSSLSLPEQDSPKIGTNRFSFSLSLGGDSIDQEPSVSRRCSTTSVERRAMLRRGSAVELSPPDSPTVSRGSPSKTGQQELNPRVDKNRAKSAEPSPGLARSYLKSGHSHSTESAPAGSTLTKRRNSPSAMRRDRFQSNAKSGVMSRSFDSSAGHMLVRHVWNRMMASKGAVTIGQDIFQRMYFTKPEMRGALKKACSQMKISNFGGFQKAHAKGVADLLDGFIRGDLDEAILVSKVEKCGKLHAECDFKNEYWETFGEAILWCSLEWGNRNQRTEESRRVWMDIINFLVDNLKSSFAESRRTIMRRSASPNTTSTES